MSRAVDEARWAAIAAAAAVAICAVALVGRLTDTAVLYAPAPGGGGLRVETALVLGLLAAAVVLPVRRPRSLAVAVCRRAYRAGINASRPALGVRL